MNDGLEREKRGSLIDFAPSRSSRYRVTRWNEFYYIVRDAHHIFAPIFASIKADNSRNLIVTHSL